MDESMIGSIRHRVPMLDGEFYNAWKNEKLEIFNEGPWRSRLHIRHQDL